MLERNEVNNIQKWLRKTFPGCYLIKLESPSTSGILDMYFAYDGKSMWFEVKRKGVKKWKNEKIQKWHAKELIRNGIPAYFVFSLDDVKIVCNLHFPHKFSKTISFESINVISNY